MILDDFIDIPFKKNSASLDGADCYGLVRLYFMAKGIELPSFNIGTDETLRIYKNFIKEIKARWQFVEAPEVDCVVALAMDAKHANTVNHFGVMVTESLMLHVMENGGSIIEELDKYKYQVKGFYRWQI